MSDDKTKVGKQDRSRINTSEDYEVADWSRKFGVSADVLKKAVKAVCDQVCASITTPCRRSFLCFTASGRNRLLIETLSINSTLAEVQGQARSAHESYRSQSDNAM